jgi:NTE family protein
VFPRPDAVACRVAPDPCARAPARRLCQPPDQTELEYLNQLPTTFVLPGEAVDRLRAAAGTIILSSPEFNGC